MNQTIVNIVIILAVGAVAVILFMGLWNMFKGQDQNRSQMLMRARVIAQAKKLGVAEPGAIVDDYVATSEKWRGRSKEIGRDIDKFADVLMTEIFSKIDLAKL